MDEYPPNLPDSESSYGYRPTFWIAVLFTALFGLTTVVHLVQALVSRRWLLLPTLVAGGCGEIIGWSGRVWSSRNLWNDTAFKIQISCLIFSPAFLSAADFIILGRIITIVGQQYSLLSASLFGKIFITVDVVSLVVQAIGGGLASAATTEESAAKGAKIMLAGIITQFISLVVYAVLGIDFARRVMFDKPVHDVAVPSAIELNTSSASGSSSDTYPKKPNGRRKGIIDSRKLKLMGFGLALSTLLLLIRGVYRIIELAGGWDGVVIHTQVYFNVFDGMMMFLTMVTFNVLHPGWLMPRI